MGDVLRRLLRTAAGVGVAALALVLIFVAWWLAVLLATGLLGYLGVRRLLGRRRAATVEAQGAPAVIDGEYRVEPEALPEAPPEQRRDL